MQLLSLGIIGQYVARIFEEAKQRPLYLVADRIDGLPAIYDAPESADVLETEAT